MHTVILLAVIVAAFVVLAYVLRRFVFPVAKKVESDVVTAVDDVKEDVAKL